MKRIATILFWVLFAFILVFFSYVYDGKIVEAIVLNLTRVPFIIAVTYLTFYLTNKFSHKSALVKVFIALGLMVAGVLLSRVVFALFVFEPFFGDEYTLTFFNGYRLLVLFIYFLSGMGGYSLLRYFFDRVAWSEKQVQLEKEKKQMELDFLKAQVNPHFLFNALNGIYSEIIKGSANAGDMVLKLSELMRFMLQEASKDFIPLTKELKLIENYIALEQMRYGDRINVTLQISDEVMQAARVSPLVLFSFVENSFKHGVSETEKEAIVVLKIEPDETDTFLFSLTNTIPKTNKSDRKKPSHKVGLSNCKRQLELVYPERFTLTQTLKGSAFVTRIKLPLHG